RVLVLYKESSSSNLRRFLADGSPDESFGAQGEVGLSGEEPRELQVLADGKILVLTANYDDAVLQRLNADGSPDESFTSVATDFLAHDFAVDPKGAGILLTGPADYDNNVLLKVDGAGIPDPAFGTDGLLQVVSGGEPVVVAWLESGEIFLIDASVGNYPNCHFRDIIRLDADGAPLEFDGSATGALQAEISLNLFHQGNELYLVGGQRLSNDTPAHGDKRMSVVGFAPDGSAIASYGTDGLAQLTSLGAPEVMWSMLKHSDGSVLASASAGTYGVLVRFENGVHDPSFGGDGFADDYPAQFTKILEDNSGNTVALSWHGGLIRFDTDGTWDQDFVPEILPGQGRDFDMDASGRFVVAGGVVGGNGTPMLARYLSDGSLDASFGLGGVVLGFDGNDGFAIAVHVDEDGKILAAGERYLPGVFPDVFIARFDEDGNLDASFGTGGITVMEGSTYVSRIIDRAAGGYYFTQQTAFGAVVKVYALDDAGELITDFGADGAAELEFKRGNLYGLLELPDGRILVAKSVQSERFEEMAVRCLLPNGEPDTGFDDDGLFVYPGPGRALALALDGDGVLVGGYHFNAETGTDVVLLRIRP
ncbi:MAG: hypothetical protein JRF33_26230, partial [Deltaproteobacteria bacterium]|nr:hypothetical protein [Deltaproteobacteria bacterium]